MLVHLTEKGVHPEVTEVIVCACPTGTLCTTIIVPWLPVTESGRVCECATGSWCFPPFSGVFGYVV